MKNTSTFLLLGALILLSSFTALSLAYVGWRQALELADLSLQNLARSLAGAVESALPPRLEKPAEYRTLLNGILGDELVAYAQISDARGTILYHSNPDLEGRTSVLDPIASGEFSGRSVLGTGEPVFEYRRPLGVENPLQMHLFLRTLRADRIIGRAKALFATVSLVVALLWLLGTSALWSFIRRRRAEQELQARQHLAYLGQMSAVLAHELRNALGSIKGYAQYLEEKLADHPSWSPAAETIVKESRRIEDLVSEMLLYSRPYEPKYSQVSVRDLLRGLVEPRAAEGLRISIREAGADIRMESDPLKLPAVLNNLIRNAREAMGGEGEIEIVVRQSRSSAVFEVRDKGPGVNEEALEKAFLPFFTTKPRGTGLGLAFSRKIVEAMGGTITRANREDEPGAVARISLPLKRRR